MSFFNGGSFASRQFSFRFYGLIQVLDDVNSCVVASLGAAAGAGEEGQESRGETSKGQKREA